MKHSIRALAAISAVLVVPSVMAFPGVPDTGLTLYGGVATMHDDDGAGTSVKPSGYDGGARITAASTIGYQAAVDYTHFHGTQSISGIDLSSNIDEVRGTIGFGIPVGFNAKIYAEGGYESARFKASAGGISASNTDKGPYFGLGGNARIAPSLDAYGRLGYLSLKPSGGNYSSGPDVLVGLGFQLSSVTALVLEYRYFDLSSDGASSRYQNINAGVRFSFQ